MTYHKKDLKNKILETTYTLVNQKGYQNVSTRMVARKLNVSATAIYRHYDSYEDLMHYTIRKGEEEFSNYLLYNMSASLSLIEKLLYMAENYITFCLEFPFLYDLMFISEYTPITSQDNMLCDLRTQGMAYLIETVESIRKEEGLRVSIETLLSQLWAYVQGYSFLVRFHHFKIEQQLIRKSIDGILEVWR